MLDIQPATKASTSFLRCAVVVFGLASAAAGVLDLVWGNFEPAHQPIQALGDHVPGQVLLAYVAAIALIGAGAGLLFGRSARAGALTLVIVYLVFALFWLPRFYTAPHALGFRAPVIIGVLGGIFMQLILVAAAGILYAAFSSRASICLHPAIRVSRWIFGLASVNFGLVHLTNVPATARMIPKWLPLPAEFWTVLTGIAFVLAGLAILAKIQDVLAARLLALMLLMFDLLVLAPLPFGSPHNHVAWGANAYNMAAVGAFWIFAESLARPHERHT